MYLYRTVDSAGNTIDFWLSLTRDNRKKIFKENVDSVFIYSTMPVGKIIGEFSLNEIICDTPENIWSRTKLFSGVDEEFFNIYFDNVKSGFALKIENLNIYQTPINLRS